MAADENGDTATSDDQSSDFSFLDSDDTSEDLRENSEEKKDFSFLDAPVDEPTADQDETASRDDDWLRPGDDEPISGEAGVPPAPADQGLKPQGTAPVDHSYNPVHDHDPDHAPTSVPEAGEHHHELGERSDEPEFLRSDGDADDEAETGDADFSWLDSDLPPDEDETTTRSSAVARDRPLPEVSDDAGFRLREEARREDESVAAAPKLPWLQRLREALGRSSSNLTGSITSIFTKRKLDEDVLQDFEDVLIQADLGVETAMRITDRLSDGRYGKEISGAEVKRVLAEEIEKTLDPVAQPLELDLEKVPHVILVVGVNGTGKTTTIGKLAAKLTRAGISVTLAAGDTFRAAAVEQLKIWGERTGSEVVARQIGADAAGLAFDAYDVAVKNKSDVLIIDTAGRLQNKAELMAELEKIIRVLQKRDPDAPHTVLQTLDATTGQNAMNQVDIFRNVAGVNGLVMTKLDGTARGGILVAIGAKHKLPVYFVGVGEGIDDLEPFKAKDFANAIAGVETEKRELPVT
ncbi:signal recognition particle-docking protein FtsY [Fulvimarina sp. MAC3]|uniref:signal recognition particle-docking protein FtsY n=1 Tax=Fulvimarina sp. MAC3 TaxID=3148887 RepID=UPI0031FC1BD4